MTTTNLDARAAVRQAIKLAEVPGKILNAYDTAGDILRMLPHLDLRLEEIVDMMLEMPGSVSAFEFSPPAVVIEIIVPSESESPTPLEAENGIARLNPLAQIGN
jgi:hypothetical protein